MDSAFNFLLDNYNNNFSTYRLKGKVKNKKQYLKRKISDTIIQNYRNKDGAKLLNDILVSYRNNKPDTEKLGFYLSNYQTRFDIEKTKTNIEIDRLEKRHKKDIELLYAKIIVEYSDTPHHLFKAKEKYGRDIYKIIRKVVNDGYNIGIDYVSRATERDDIYITQKDLDNVKEQSERTYNNFWESIEKNIRNKNAADKYRELVTNPLENIINEQDNTGVIDIDTPTLDNNTMTESLKISTEQLKPEDTLIFDENNNANIVPDILPINQQKLNPILTPEQSMTLLFKTLTTSILNLAVLDKMNQISDDLARQNVTVRYVFATELDDRVCPQCARQDYRLTGLSYTQETLNQVLQPPVHFNCRCRMLLKIGSQIISA